MMADEINVHIVESLIEELDNYNSHLEVYIETPDGDLHWTGDVTTRDHPSLGTIVVIKSDGKIEDS